MSNEHLAAIVLAAGKGTRMESDLHKVLHELAGKPMLGHVLDTLACLEISKTLVVVGAGREQIETAYPSLATVVQEEQLGTGHAVRVTESALADFDGVVLILYGDVPLVTSDTLLRLANKVTQQCALAVLGFRPGETAAYGRLQTTESGRLERIIEHADATDEERAIQFCNSGIMAADKKRLFEMLSQISNNNSKGEYYLTDIVEKMNRAGHRVETVEASPLEVSGVNSKAELDSLNQTLLNQSNV